MTGSQGGAPRFNRNAMRHGLRASKLPKNCKYLEDTVREFRRQTEDAVVTHKGEISLVDAARIQSAARHERRAMLLERMYRIEEDRVVTAKTATRPGSDVSASTRTESGLSLADRLALLRDISAATDSRDKALAALNLDTPQANVWSSLPPLLNVPQSPQSDVNTKDGQRVTPDASESPTEKPRDDSVAAPDAAEIHTGATDGNQNPA